MIIDSTFKTLLTRYKVTDIEAQQAIAKVTKKVDFNPGQVLYPLGCQPSFMYWVEKGLLRSVFYTESGKEFSKEFYWEGDVFLGIRNLLNGEPLPYEVVAVEQSHCFQTPLKNYNLARQAFQCWQQFHQGFLEAHILAKEFKEELLLLNSNEQKVVRIYETYPEFVSRVPGTLLASYLGLTPVSLSRIKKRLGL